MARRAPGYDGTDEVSESIDYSRGIYTYPLEASIAIGNEGEIPVVPYVHD